MRQVAPLRPDVLLRGAVGSVADVGARVEPVVGADGDAHEAEGGDGPREDQQALHPTVTPRHAVSSSARPRPRQHQHQLRSHCFINLFLLLSSLFSPIFIARIPALINSSNSTDAALAASHAPKFVSSLI